MNTDRSQLILTLTNQLMWIRQFFKPHEDGVGVVIDGMDGAAVRRWLESVDGAISLAVAIDQTLESTK